MKQEDINYNFILAIIIIGFLLILNMGISLYIDDRVDKLEEPEQITNHNTCYINIGEKTFVVGMPKGNGDLGYYYVEPTYREGTEVEYTKNKLKLCDGTIFVNLITEIYNNEKLLSDAKGRKHDG